jgi:hypothetical protein
MEADAQEFEHILRVVCVSHRYIRVMVEKLALAGAQVSVAEMQIEGSRPLESPTTSVTERGIDAWIDDPTTYPGAWPHPEIPIEVVSSEHGVTVDVELAQAPSSEIRDRLETKLVGWPGDVATYLDEQGHNVDLLGDFNKRVPSFGGKKRVVTAYYEHIANTREPSRAALVNMLACFNKKIAPIARVRIAM